VSAATPETLLALAFALPLAAAVLIPLCHRAPNLREAVTLIAAAGLAWAVWSLLPAVLAGARPTWHLVRVAPGLDLALEVEPLGMLFALVAGSLWIVNSVYSVGYMRANGEPRQTSFYLCFAVSLFATMGVAFAANLFTLFVFYELLTLCTYPLVTHKGTPEAMRAGRVYLVLLLATSTVLLLPAIVATGFIAGTLEFAPGGVLGGKTSPAVLGVLLAMYAFGIGKAALIPVHFWLPAAMVAPTPVSALLHAVAVVKAGVFAVLKVVIDVFGVDTLADAGTAGWLVWAAGGTVLLASVAALAQDNLKKRLAFSTVSQLSYVVLAAAVLVPVSVVGAAVHIAAHAVAKITLFFAAGSIYTAAHKSEISELDGIGRRMPWTMAAFAIGALGMIGLPPTAGFVGKWYLLQGAAGDARWGVVAVVAASTLLNAAYFLPIVWRAFFVAAPAHDGHAHGEAPWPMVLALTVTAGATVLLFVVPDVPLALARAMLSP
jgi:multicomponent Na+:H+ antiporter subunit D